MKVILTQSVAGLGDAGTVKEVADGYARNYLIPQRLAVAATKGNLRQAEAQAQIAARKGEKALGEAQQSATALQERTVVIRARVGSENRLYGSVTPADVAEALKAQLGIDIDRRKIELNEAIHRIGTYPAAADLGHGVSARFNVEVAPEVPGASGKAVRASSAAQAAADVTPPAPVAEQQVEANPS